MTSTPLSGKVAFVTGGASGIGASIVDAYIMAGARVIIGDLDYEKATKYAKTFGSDVCAIALDVAKEDQWKAAFSEIRHRYGQLDILTNAAGVPGFGNIESMNTDVWQRALDINLSGTMLGCRHSIDLMRPKGGSIINLASSLALRPRPEQLAYSVSKAGVISLTKAVALHCARSDYNIRCNAILPGVVDTPMLRSNADKFGGADKLIAAMSALHPLKRVAQASEIAQLALYLATDAASFITAGIYTIDGGLAEA